MRGYLASDLILHLIYFQAVLLLNILGNIFLARRARRHPPPKILPQVSILVPARNEEHNITTCLESLLVQDYPDFELIALDDQSRDGTRAVLEQVSRANPALRVLEGTAPPDGQVGKNWACSQLARAAGGELLLFTDADTRHHPGALKALVAALEAEDADLLTGYPRQEVHSWGERLLVPFFSWAMLSFIPLVLAYRLRTPALAGAVGQLMLFRRKAYLAVGGHEAVRGSIVDDLSLARRIKSAGLRWKVVHAADLVSCRMYSSGREAREGFAKNLFAAFGFRLLPYGFAFLWLVITFWLPLIILGSWLAGLAPLAQLPCLLLCIGISLLVWMIPYWHLRIPLILALLYPITILVNTWAAVRSARDSLSGRLHWKGRDLPPQKWTWF